MMKSQCDRQTRQRGDQHKCPAPSPSTSRQHFSVCSHHIIIQFFFLLLLLFPAVALCSFEDATVSETIKIYQQLPGNNTGIKPPPLINTLSYIQLRALRAFCTLADATTENIQPVVKKLKKTTIRYNVMLLLDSFSALPGATIDSSWLLLNLLKDTSFTVNQTLVPITHLAPPSALAIIPLIKNVKLLNEAGQWAAKALFSIKTINFNEIQQAIFLLSTMTTAQQRAAEKLCELSRITGSDILPGFHSILLLSKSDAWNVQAFLNDPSLSPQMAGHWLSSFFAQPLDTQNKIVNQLKPKEKTLLLATYSKASAKIIQAINSLHDITDVFGQEIGFGRLNHYPAEKFLSLLTKLHVQVQKKYQQKMELAISANNRKEAITLLKKATKMSRTLLARELSSADIYILLARGNELFTSSFKNFLVPVLTRRIKIAYQNNLLTFITTVDPASNYTSDFIVNLAGKGSLTRFLPKETIQQQKVLDLVTQSALQDERSLLLFSAAFTKLLSPLRAESRSHLLDLLITAARDKSRQFSLQLQVILQYYLEKRSSLLSISDRKKITVMLTKSPPINLTVLKKTPFKEWLQDHELRSLSVFQHDDDGRSSFLSNCRGLLSAGYKPALSTTFIPGYLTTKAKHELQMIFRTLHHKPEYGLTQLFRFSVKYSIVCDWVKKVNSITITHAVTIYKDKKQQQRLIVQFIKNGTEMFAQRGHSYWRPQQLFIPLAGALASGEINDRDLTDKQRFLSLGSCGSLNAYSQLSRQFHNKVDILATTGIGKAVINNPFNRIFFEIVARNPKMHAWDEVTRKTASIFSKGNGGEYIQPGSLPAILHKMLHKTAQYNDTHQTN